LSDLNNIPDGARAIFDTNIFVYWVTNHPRFGGTCKEVMKCVEADKIRGVVPAVVLNELLHRLMIAETVDLGYASFPQDAVRKLKDNPAIIKDLSLAWEIFQALPDMGFEVVEDERGLSDLTYYFSKERGLMAKDAAIVAYAHKYEIYDLVTNDHDFHRIDWLTCWSP